jgi:DNA replication protein DnaC
MAECERCGGTRWVIESDGDHRIARACPKCRVPDQADRRLRSAQIPPRYLDRGFDIFSIHDPTQEAALKRAIAFVENYPLNERGLLLAGPCGVGKTHLAVAALKALIIERKVSGRFVDESELLRRLQFSYGPDSPDTERDVLLPLMNVELLVWDDLGTRRQTDWARETIGMILNYRYTNRLLTLMTSNWSLEPSDRDQKSSELLQERIGLRLFSRILEMCEVVRVTGPDARAEIHKAGQDFKTRRRQVRTIPAGLVKCPSCRSARVVQPSHSESNSRAPSGFILEDFVCGDCGARFQARYSLKTAQVEYTR